MNVEPMKVFLCWSGRETASYAAADMLNEYLPLLCDRWTPFLSEYDIKAGTLWMDELFAALDKSTFGIVCISPRQKNSPWILFEAGALSKAVSSNRVLPLLVCVESTELADPLGKFQHKKLNKEGIVSVLDSLCDATTDLSADARKLVFDRFTRLGEMKEPMRRIRQQANDERRSVPAPPPETPLEKILKEFQGQIFDLANRVQKLTSHDPPPVAVVQPGQVAPATNVIVAQPGQSFTVGETAPANEKGSKDG